MFVQVKSVLGMGASGVRNRCFGLDWIICAVNNDLWMFCVGVGSWLGMDHLC